MSPVPAAFEGIVAFGGLTSKLRNIDVTDHLLPVGRARRGVRRALDMR